MSERILLAPGSILWFVPKSGQAYQAYRKGEVRILAMNGAVGLAFIDGGRVAVHPGGKVVTQDECLIGRCWASRDDWQFSFAAPHTPVDVGLRRGGADFYWPVEAE
jgi:hypothetical protein